MDHQNVIIGIAGRRGSGKSTIARRILERCERLVVWDPMAEHRWIPNALEDQETLERFLGWASTQDTFAGRYIPDANLPEEFSELAWMVYDQENLVLGVEEVPMLCSPSSLPYDFDRLVRLGRHADVSLVWTAQRMVEVARRLTAATDVFILFAHTEPRDLNGIADRCGSEVARRVAELPRHGYLIWDAVEACEVEFDSLVKALGQNDRVYDSVGVS